MKNIYHTHIQQHSTGIFKLYAGGSLTEQVISFAVQSKNFSTSERASNSTSIFTSELYGNLEVINYNANETKENITIATESKSLIQEI